MVFALLGVAATAQTPGMTPQGTPPGSVQPGTGTVQPGGAIEPQTQPGTAVPESIQPGVDGTNGKNRAGRQTPDGINQPIQPGATPPSNPNHPATPGVQTPGTSQPGSQTTPQLRHEGSRN